MKIIGKVEVESVTDVVCDVCRLTTRVTTGGLQYATLQAAWGYGTKHDGEHYELHLCEGCFFQAVANLKQERRIQSLFGNDELADEAAVTEDFGLVGRDNFFGDR